MTTIKLAVLRHTQAKNGTFKIRIAIGHRSETHYIVTRYRINSLANFRDGVVTGQPDAKALNIKLRQLLNEYDERLERIPHANDLTCEELRNLLRDMPSQQQSTTLEQVLDIYTRQLIQEDRKTTADLIAYHVRRFLSYTNGDILLSSITPRLIDEYHHYLRSQHLSPSYISICISSVRTVVYHAIKMQYVRYDTNPFQYYHKPQSIPRDLDISVQDMHTLFNFRPANHRTRRSLDLFLLSYMLGGMNLVDLLAYDFRNTDTIRYNRKKTHNRNPRPTVFSIPDDAKPIIQRLMNPDTGLLKTEYNGTFHSLTVNTNRSLKHIVELAGFSCKRISFYSARKSFIQHGFDLGIPLEVLEYCSGQTMKTNRPIFNYVKIMQRHADEAIRKILDNTKNLPILTDGQEKHNN